MATNSAVKKREFDFTDKDFQELGRIIYDRTGIVISDAKKNMIYGRIVKRLRALKMDSFSDYVAFISSKEGDSEAIDFINAITTNLTKFFRENHHFEHLGDKVIAPLISNRGGSKRVRVWSAGCSSGMEAYSIAMTVAETIPDLVSWDFKILATDIDTNMLNRGKNGIYTNKDIENVPEKLVKKYFKKYDDDNMIISEKLRKMVHFKRFNLLENIWPMKGPFDVIFCRNVVIYFDAKTQSQLFRNYHKVLKDGGWFYIGHSETLLDTAELFDSQGKTIFMRL